jgi:hypothetical protein
MTCPIVCVSPFILLFSNFENNTQQYAVKTILGKKNGEKK